MHDAIIPPRRMRYSFEARCRAVQRISAGAPVALAAAGVGASRATAYRWWARFQADGWAGLHDRPSTPKRQPRRLSVAAEAEILAAREHSGAGPLTLSGLLGRPASTVGKVLRRLGRSRLPREPRLPVVRYERERPGELLHVDTKKLGRFWHVGKRIRRDRVQRSPRAGWQHVHVAVDDHSRLAYAEVLPTDRAEDAIAFLERALRWFAEQGIAVEAVMTDNGPAYLSHAWQRRCVALGLRHLRTRPYTPRTNGKAERFIQLLLRRWAYAFAYPTSAHRARALPGWLRWYNRRRPHGSLGGLPPVSRVSQVRGQYS
jgi:transposase InsO family protein